MKWILVSLEIFTDMWTENPKKKVYFMEYNVYALDDKYMYKNLSI